MNKKICTLWSANKKILNNKGSSFIELLYVILYIAIIMSLLFQVYFIIQGEILVVNATRFALRQVEVNGVKGDVEQQVREFLIKNNNIDLSTVNVSIKDKNGVEAAKFQLRDPIRVKVEATYNVFRINGTSYFTVPLSCTYVGSSQKYDKNYNGGAYDAVN